MKYCFYSLIVLVIAVGCSRSELPQSFTAKGISYELAQYRAKVYSNIEYKLRFSLPAQKEDPVLAHVVISFDYSDGKDLILDFTGDSEAIDELKVNNNSVNYRVENQHIIIPGRSLKRGHNQVAIQFTAGDQSLNRRDDFLYTLLVPDRARTLFPCFEQPDLKAHFTLELELPTRWIAVANGAEIESKDGANGRKVITFDRSEPISTYLFSFVAGEFEKVTSRRGDREISLYHREDDTLKIAQCDAIFDEVWHSLEWMEDYTAIPYPFQKYDLIILPGFQYGGMEHMGATLYNDRRMFLEPNATDAEILTRSRLVAHETSHMWFGDYVTMRWFNDVWNKEVFANWFAAQIVEPIYPEINHHLGFIIDNYPSAYSEDRTGGSVPIQQELDNLSNAGLVYCKIIYNKSPIVMEMLVKKIGHDKFRTAIREYLKKYAYGNSDWDDLISIIDNYCDEDLRAWSDVWVKAKGMPTIEVAHDGDFFTMSQSDPWERGFLWNQRVELAEISDRGYIISRKEIDFDKEYRLAGSYIPNSNGESYGYFKLDKATSTKMLNSWHHYKDEALRLSALMMLYENLLDLQIEPNDFLHSIIDALPIESNPQIFRCILAYGESCVKLFKERSLTSLPEYEILLNEMGELHPNIQNRVSSIRSFYRIASTTWAINRVKSIWSDEVLRKRLNISEADQIAIAYELALHFPELAPQILEEQLSRITNPDRRKEFEFISRALSPSKSDRDNFFRELLLAENRTVEPWAITALGLLNHPLHQKDALEYIRPALDALIDVQRTGDIFLPANWCAALLRGHTSPEALDIVEHFFADNPDYSELLANKIRQSADYLYIVNGRAKNRLQSR